MSDRGIVQRSHSSLIFPQAQLLRCIRFRDDLVSAVKVALAKQEPDSQTRFHEQFRKEADEYDKDLHKKYHDDFNSTLIFVRHFRRYTRILLISG